MNSVYPAEQWLPAPYPEYAEYYSVSDYGRVMRTQTPTGKPRQRILSSETSAFYLQVHLCAKGNKKVIAVHILVALAFLGERPEGMEINHRDRNTLNNYATNLEYVTSSENKRHASATVFHKYTSVLTWAKVARIRAAYSSGMTLRELGEDYGTCPSNIHAIVTERTWKHTPAPQPTTGDDNR
jgi:hypothetical protein